jgi:anti-sigma factor RsiW
MSECRNASIRELLPEYLAGKLGARAVLVEQHLGQCEECRADMALMRLVRESYARAPEVNVWRVLAAIPRAPRHRVPLAIRRSTLLQLAAALSFVVIGGASLVIARSFSATTSPYPPTVAEAGSDSDLRLAGSTFAISFGGGVEDLAPEELQALVEAIDALEPAPPAEPPDGDGMVGARSGDS